MPSITNCIVLIPNESDLGELLDKELKNDCNYVQTTGRRYKYTPRNKNNWMKLRSQPKIWK